MTLSPSQGMSHILHVLDPFGADLHRVQGHALNFHMKNFRADKNPRDKLHFFLISEKLKCKKVTIGYYQVCVTGTKAGLTYSLKTEAIFLGLGSTE